MSLLWQGGRIRKRTCPLSLTCLVLLLVWCAAVGGDAG
jgi:hypothetical protein